jgi:hypothetical protein
MREFATMQGQKLISELAYQLWEKRGRPFGSPEVDWYAAKKALACSTQGLEAEYSLYCFSMEPDEGPYRAPREE